MLFLIFLQCCLDKFIHAHTLRLCVVFQWFTFSLWNIKNDRIIVFLSISLVCRNLLLVVMFFLTVLAALLRTTCDGISIITFRTNLCTSNGYGQSCFLLFCIRFISQNLCLIPAINAVFSSV